MRAVKAFLTGATGFIGGHVARDEKARRELGFTPRDLDTGLRQTLEATPG